VIRQRYNEEFFLSLFAEYKRSLKMVEVEEPFDLYFHRIISFMFVKLILPLPVSPNQISVAAMVMGVISGAFFALGTTQGNIYAALFYALYYLLDLSDGQVARLKKNGSTLGRVIDGISDYVTHLAIFIGLGVAVWSGSGQSLFSLGLVVLAMFSLLLHAVLFDYYRNRYLDYAFGTVSLYGDDLAELLDEQKRLDKEGGHQVSRFVLSMYLKYLALQNMLLPVKDAGRSEKVFDSEDFLQRNKLPIRLWSMMGTSLHITLLIVLALMDQIGWYLYTVVGVINIYAVIMMVMQGFVDKNTGRHSEERMAKVG
jgi:hypothetical protein